MGTGLVAAMAADVGCCSEGRKLEVAKNMHTEAAVKATGV